MKPDGVTMETIEPTEATVEAEPSLSQAAAMQEEVTQQAPSPSQPEVTANTQEPENSTAPPAPQEANGRPAAAAVDSKAKPKGISSKVQAGATTGITKTTGASKPNSRPGTSTSRTVNGVKPSTNDPTKKTSAKKITSTTAASTSGAVPKRQQGTAAFSTVRTQTKVADKKPLGPARTTSAAAAAAATVTHGTKPATGSGIPNKRPPAGPVNGARPKLTAPTSKVATSTAPKPSTSTAAKTAKTTRPAAGPSTSRPSSSTASFKPSTAGPRTATVKPSTAGHGTTTAAAKPSTTASSSTRPVASRVTTAPSAGRTTAAQAPKNNAAVKKDISRPASAAAIKKPTATTSTTTKKPEPSKLAATSRPDPASKRPPPTKAAEPKTPRPKTQEPPKHPPAKKAAPPITQPLVPNRLALGRTPPASPANKPISSSTPQAAKRPKPTQSVVPFTPTKKTQIQNSNSASAEAAPAAAASAAVTAMAATATAATASVAAAVIVGEPAQVPAAAQAEAEAAVPEMPSAIAAVPEEVPIVSLAQDTPAEMVPLAALDAAAVLSPPQSPVRAAVSPAPPSQDLAESPAPLVVAQEQNSAPVEAVIQTVVSSPQQEPSEEPVHLIPDQTPSTSKAPPLVGAISPPLATSSNLNEEEEEEDEEEREGSQQVSVSDMSGTTQPTEESRPGSAGPAGTSAWRAGGALLSELDSEEVSQQGASELSAPGVLEGTESMDDLGDGSLKGAIDMEGASAGSPDFERVPDIPTNDFEEDEDDYDDEDEDRVCDMDVGSERAEAPRRARHDNEVEEEEEDEDVEMASEGVTESGLESYGNADEDDFAEDERLDNLNRAAHQLPPPPLLPSVPAAQWDQPNPFTDPWAQPLPPLQPQQHLQHHSQPFHTAMVSPAPASPSTDPWQVDSETPTQSPAQAWLELGSAPFIPQNHEASHRSSILVEPPKPEHQTDMDKSSPAPMQTLSPALLPVPGMSQSSTMSSETSTPEELRDYNREGRLRSQAAQAPVLSLQPDPEDQDLGIHLEQGDGEGDEDAEAETLPADEVLGGPATAPTSNPSSSSTTEDEASDTEGEAQLEDPMDGRGSDDVAFDIQPPTLCSLSALEEGEEAGPEEGEGGAREDVTPPSANSAASYGFDTMTTASNSNAQSTGDSCTKSPGIFSLEELPEEAKESFIFQELNQGPQSLPSQPGSNPAEQHYMLCGQQTAQLVEDRGEGNGSEGALDPPLSTLTSQQRPEDDPTDLQPPYYSAICEKTENSLAGNV